MNTEILLPSFAIGMSIALLSFATPFTVWPLLLGLWNRRVQSYKDKLDFLQEFQGNPAIYVVAEIALALAGGTALYAFFRATVFGVIGFGVGAIVPSMNMKKRVQMRRERLELQLPDAITAISSSVQAGLALPSAIEEAADKLSGPIGQELSLLSRQYKTGLPLDDVLRLAQKRLKSRHFNLISSALIINRERGGDLVQILDRLGTSLREIYRLEAKIRTETAGPRFEGKVMLLVPPFVLVMLHFAMPEAVNEMFHSLLGIVITIVAALLMVVAYFWMRGIVEEEV